MDGNAFNNLGKGLGVWGGGFFGLFMVGALLAGGFGWWSLLGWPACVAVGLAAGAVLDGM